ncbi:hypothetical protein FPQ18DRAFT_347179, partial [Pyronema domesticum]
SIRSFVSAHDPIRRPCFPAAAHRRSARYTSPSREHHPPLLRTESSFVGHSVARTNTHSSARPVVLAYDPMRQPRSPCNSAPALFSLQSCLRATTTCSAIAHTPALNTHNFFPSASVLRALLPLSTTTGPDRPIRRGLDRWMATQIPPTSPEAPGELMTTFLGISKAALPRR